MERIKQRKTIYEFDSRKLRRDYCARNRITASGENVSVSEGEMNNSNPSCEGEGESKREMRKLAFSISFYV